MGSLGFIPVLVIRKHTHNTQAETPRLWQTSVYGVYGQYKGLPCARIETPAQQPLYNAVAVALSRRQHN